MTTIHSPITLPCGITIKNRLCKSATTEALATIQGVPTPALIALYEQWAQGGVGLIISGNVMIDKHHLERVGNVILDKSNVNHKLIKNWAQAGSQNNTQFWLQLSHSGRQCPRLVNKHPKAPSAVQLKLAGNFGVPLAMTERDILETIEQFVQAAVIAKEHGFTGVQIHSAHGYLCNQFLSPITNQRQDQWGGTLINRARFLLSIIQAIRKAVGPTFAIAVKLNSSDFQTGGFSLEDSIKVAQWLEAENIDLLEISGGTYEQTVFLSTQKTALASSTQKREAFFLEYAAAIKDVLQKTPIMVTGGFRTQEGMNQALKSKDTDIIGIARPLCVDPTCANQMLNGTIDHFPSYENTLTLAKTGWFSNQNHHKVARALNAQAQAAWFMAHMHAIGQSRRQQLPLSLPFILIKSYGRDIWLSIQRQFRRI